MLTDQRHEGHRSQVLGGRALALLAHADQILEACGANRGHQPTAVGQLIQERLRHLGSGRGDDNSLEGSSLRPAGCAIAHVHVHVVAAELNQQPLRPLGQHCVSLDGVDSLDQFAEDGCLVATAGADLQGALVPR